LPDPRDPKSHPPIATKLRVKAMRQDRFRLRFESIQELAESVRYTLNAGSRTYFAQIGDTIEGYTLERYDAPTRTLYVTAAGRQVGLPMRRDVIDDLITVELVSLIDGGTFTVRKDETFAFRGAEYQVTELGSVRDRTVTLTEKGTNTTFTVTEATQDEREELLNRQRTPFEFEAEHATPGPVPPRAGGVQRMP
jgi:hypothetical protein